MSQTVYSLDPAVGYAGYPFDSALKDVTSAVASEEIPFGVFVERSADGTVRRWRGTGKFLGMAIARDTRESGSFAVGGSATYKTGAQVPVARRGRYFAQFESNVASVALNQTNVWAASDDSQSNLAKRGIATSRATSATTGLEITAPAGVQFWRIAGSTEVICIVELSLS